MLLIISVIERQSPKTGVETLSKELFWLLSFDLLQLDNEYVTRLGFQVSDLTAEKNGKALRAILLTNRVLLAVLSKANTW